MRRIFLPTFLCFLLIVSAAAFAQIIIEKVVTSGPDVDGDGVIDLVVEVGQTEPTLYDFTIYYSGPPVMIQDMVPAEWQVVEVLPDNEEDRLQISHANKKDNNKSATRIAWWPGDGDSKLLVVVESRWRPSGKYAPTSCGVLYLNEDGAEVYAIDPETGEPLVDEYGEMLPPIAISNPLELVAVSDVNEDGVIARDGTGDEDGDGLTDAYEALELGTDPCNPDTDDDGVPDGADPDPLDPCVPIPCE